MRYPKEELVFFSEAYVSEDHDSDLVTDKVMDYVHEVKDFIMVIVLVVYEMLKQKVQQVICSVKIGGKEVLNTHCLVVRQEPISTAVLKEAKIVATKASIERVLEEMKVVVIIV